jgi:uncharacterized protein (UPF0276 family)
MNSYLKWSLVGLTVLMALGVLLLVLRSNEDSWIKDSSGNWVKHGNPAIQDFDSCAQKYPVLLTYPEQCSIPNGPTFSKP